MKRILLPTDFSINSWSTMVYIMQLYRTIPCEFHIVNAYELSPLQLTRGLSSQRIGQLYNIAEKTSEKELEIVLQSIRNVKISETHSFVMLSKKGTALEVIQNILSTGNIELIAMSMKGASNTKDFFIGRTTQKILKHIHTCPVMIIPDGYYYTRIVAIAFATNFEQKYDPSEIAPILELAKHTDATIRMIQVYDTPNLTPMQQYNSDMLAQYFKDIKYEYHVIADFSTTEKAIQACIEDLEIDILVMIHYQHGFIEQFLREAVIKKMAFHTQIPFLIIPEDQT